jgi:hypothetical protein
VVSRRGGKGVEKRKDGFEMEGSALESFVQQN